MMKRVLLVTLLAATALMLASTSGASATVLCKTATEPCTSAWPAGTTLQTSLKSGSQFTLEAGFVTISCSETSMKGEVTNAGPSGNVSGTITSISFGGCGSVTADVLNSKGTFSIESGTGGNGTVALTGVEVTFSYLGTSCVYGFGGGTSVGQLSGGSMASMTEEASVPKISGGFSCASPAKWKAPLTVTSPEPLYVEAKEAAGEPVVLCKVAAEPCTSPYGKETTIEGTIVGSWLLKAGFAEIKCTGASINGSVTNPGPTGPVTGPVNSIGFSSCGSATVDVLKNGTFSIGSPSGGNSTFKLEGFEVTVSVAGTSCVYGGTVSFSLTGGATASLKSTGSLAKLSGGATCASPASLTAEYKVNLPEPLYVEAKEGVSEPVVLCKTATSPCSGGTYAKGTAIEATLTGSWLLKGGFAEITCTSNTIKGEVTNPGPSGPVAGTVSSLSFSSCGESTVDVLKNGTFSIGSPTAGNGTFKLEGSEFTVARLGTSCVYGPATFSLTGGATASLKSAGSLNKVSGGFLCANPAALTAEFKITTPAPLFVEAS
jgi:hypothetical protein